MIVKNGINYKAYKGDYKPCQMYLGDKKIAGYTSQTQTGNALTFNNTYNDVFSDLSVDCDSKQLVTIQGKQLFDVTKINNTNSATLSQIASGIRVSSTTGIYTDGHISMQLIPNTTYTFQRNATVISGNAGTRVAVCAIQPIYGGYSLLVLTGIGTKSGSFTTDSTGIVWIVFTGAFDVDNAVSIDYTNIQLELGITATPYSPFIPNSPSLGYPAPITGTQYITTSATKNLIKPAVGSITVGASPATNLITNGNFALDSNGDGLADGFASTRITGIACVNNEQNFVVIKQYGKILTPYNYVAGHRYFVTATVKTLTSQAQLMAAQNSTSFKSMDCLGDGVYHTLSLIVDIDAFFSYGYFCIQDASPDSWQNISVKNFMAIDMGTSSSDNFYSNTLDQMAQMVTDAGGYWYGAKTLGGVTCTVSADQSITLNGIAAKGCYLPIYPMFMTIPNVGAISLILIAGSKYTLSQTVIAGSKTDQITFSGYDENGLLASNMLFTPNDNALPHTFTGGVAENSGWSSSANLRNMIIWIKAGTVFTNYTFKLQFEQSDVTTSWEQSKGVTLYKLPREGFDGDVWDAINNRMLASKILFPITGNESGWTYNPASTAGNVSITKSFVAIKDVWTRNISTSNYFKGATDAKGYHGIQGYFDIDASGTVYFGFSMAYLGLASDATNAQKLSAALAWLQAKYSAGVPVILLAPLTVPQVIQGAAQTIPTYPNQTTISSSGTITATCKIQD